LRICSLWVSRLLLNDEFQVDLDRSEIDVLEVTPWHQRVVIVWHSDMMPEDGWRPVTATAAPAAASPLAMPRPIPPLPPVTTATRPVRSNNVIGNLPIAAGAALY
jgi:hypothetical protein